MVVRYRASCRYSVLLFGLRHGERRRGQRLLHPLALGDVGRHAAHGVGDAIRIEQRKLRREENPRPVAEIRRLLEFDRALLAQHAQVVVAESRRELGRENFLVATTDDFVRPVPAELLESAVDEQVAALLVLREDQRAGVVQHLLQARVARRCRARGCGLSEAHSTSMSFSPTVRSFEYRHGRSATRRTVTRLKQSYPVDAERTRVELVGTNM